MSSSIWLRFALAGGLLVPVACGNEEGTDPTGLICGEGTVEVDGVCTAEGGVTCGPDTVEQDGVCVAGVYSNGWDNALTQELGVTLIKEFPDSDTGPDAWNPADHPLVFVTTLGPGYGGELGATTWPGVAIIDADDYSVVTSRNYDMSSEGWTDVFEPHGLAVSMDGKYIYLPTGDGRAVGRVLIINARTLKIDKIIGTRGRPHHLNAFVDANGNERVVGYGWEQPPFVMDPADNNRVVGGFSFNESGIEGYGYFVTPDGTEMWASGRWRKGSAVDDVIHGQLFFNVSTDDWKLLDYMTFPDETTPIWIEFSPDNRYAFVSGGHTSSVLRYDRTLTWQENQANPNITPTGVVGPYGIRFGWDGSRIYAVGKQEGAGNQGIDLGVIDTSRLGEVGYEGTNVITDCLRGDHATLHPTRAAQEIWITCNSSFEIAVFDMATNTVSHRIPMPDTGSTHSGSFVRYASDFTGTVLSDQNGLHGTARAEQLASWTMP